MKSKLDVSALFHCAMKNSKYINTFRITITLKEKIDEVILQQVVDELIHQYPTICSRISKDFFWYYTKSLKSIKVQKDKDIFSTINEQSIYENAIAIFYKNNTISIEIFHGVSDGHGVFIYVHDLITQYIYKKYHLENNENISIESQITDAFVETPTKTYKKQDSINYKNNFQFSKRTTNATTKVTTLKINIQEIKELASKHSCTINELLLSLFYRSILNKKHNKNVFISVPINLRRTFKSNTVKNFTLIANLKMKFQEGLSIENLIQEIKMQMNKHKNKEYLGYEIKKVKRLNTITYYLPIFIKNLGIRLGAFFVGNKGCMTISNVGKISFKDNRIHDYIDSMDAILCPRASTPYNCGIVTMNNNLHINITHDDNNEDLIFNLEKELNHLNIQFSKFDYQERLNYC